MEHPCPWYLAWQRAQVHPKTEQPQGRALLLLSVVLVRPGRLCPLCWLGLWVPWLLTASPVSCPGMEVYPSRTQLPELLPQPVLAGVIGGICFLSVAVIFSTMAACIMNRRRAARIQKRRQGRSCCPGAGTWIPRLPGSSKQHVPGGWQRLVPRAPLWGVAGEGSRAERLPLSPHRHF